MDTHADLFKSTLRIFLSVDIVGSTAFKQSTSSVSSDKAEEDIPAEPWFSPIAQFYRGIEREFANEWVQCKIELEKVSWPCGDDPELWKSVGDELIYTKTLANHREALSVVNAWKCAVSKYRIELKEQFPSLDLKSTAWIAGFPVHNAEVIFRSSVAGLQEKEADDDPIYANLRLLNEYRKSPDSSKFRRDFIGPAIDTGFRLGQVATPRRFVISVDLALLLVHAARAQQSDFFYQKLIFFYEGRQTFKGVFGGQPYPIFWIDMKPDERLEESEDRLLPRIQANTDHMIEFCERYVRSNTKYSFVPYIKDNPDAFFATVPTHHAERIEKIRTFWENERVKRQVEEQSALEGDVASESREPAGQAMASDTDDLLGVLKRAIEAVLLGR